MDRNAIFDAVRDVAPDAFTVPAHIKLLDAVLDVLGVSGGEAHETASVGFDAALAVILRHEGGYVNHPKDPGGMTNLGVTRRVWESWTGQKSSEADMRALTQSKVAPLYRKNYWEASGADQLPDGLALCVFDFAVNAGPSRAVRYLQDISGASIDGQFGPQTLAEVEKDIREEGEAAIIKRYQKAREQYYRSLKTFSTFGRGWLRRNSETTEQALEWTA